MAPRLLIVDDDDGFRTIARELLDVEGFSVVATAADGTSALALADVVRPDVVLVDMQLPGMGGADLAQHLLSKPDAPVVVLTSGRGIEDYGPQVSRCPGVTGFIPKAEVSGPRLRAVLDGSPGAAA